MFVQVLLCCLFKDRSCRCGRYMRILTLEPARSSCRSLLAGYEGTCPPFFLYFPLFFLLFVNFRFLLNYLLFSVPRREVIYCRRPVVRGHREFLRLRYAPYRPRIWGVSGICFYFCCMSMLCFYVFMYLFMYLVCKFCCLSFFVSLSWIFK